jgi:hypothetical protein
VISSISKEKIPKDYSFVLKTSQLEELLRDGNINTDVTLHYWKPQLIGSIFEVHYWLPNENIPYNRLYIRAGAILRKDIHIARDGLLTKVFPEFFRWIMNIEQLEESSTHYSQLYFNADFRDNKISIVSD